MTKLQLDNLLSRLERGRLWARIEAALGEPQSVRAARAAEAKARKVISDFEDRREGEVLKRWKAIEKRRDMARETVIFGYSVHDAQAAVKAIEALADGRDARDEG